MKGFLRLYVTLAPKSVEACYYEHVQHQQHLPSSHHKRQQQPELDLERSGTDEMHTKDALKEDAI